MWAKTTKSKCVGQISSGRHGRHTDKQPTARTDAGLWAHTISGYVFQQVHASIDSTQNKKNISKESQNLCNNTLNVIFKQQQRLPKIAKPKEAAANPKALSINMKKGEK